MTPTRSPTRSSPGGAAFLDVLAAFGAGILDANGEIDRRRLGGIVFSDAARLRQLEVIVHPAVLARISEALATAGEEVVVLDAIKLLESGLSLVCDTVWVVTCPRDQQAWPPAANAGPDVRRRCCASTPSRRRRRRRGGRTW